MTFPLSKSDAAADDVQAARAAGGGTAPLSVNEDDEALKVIGSRVPGRDRP